MRRDAIVEVVEVKPVSLADVSEDAVDREEQGTSASPARPQPIKA